MDERLDLVDCEDGYHAILVKFSELDGLTNERLEELARLRQFSARVLQRF